MATVWHHYGYPLPNTCETATNRVPNIKGKSGARRSGLKKVKNEHRFIGLRTYVHWPTNIGSSAHEHRFIFSRGAVGIKTVLAGIPQKWQKILKTCYLTFPPFPCYLRDLYLGHRLDKFTVNYRGIHVNFRHGLPVISHYYRIQYKKISYLCKVL